ncbi:RNA polymerase sigma factor [Actinomycetes bacterium M1A6_2h]
MADLAGSVLDEPALLMAARNGDQHAFGQLVGLHKNRVWAVCLNIAGNRQDAEDAVQDTLIAAWQHLDKFRGEARFSTWLHRVASNAALALVRKRKPQTDTVDFNDPERPVHLEDEAASSFGDRMAARDQLRTALADIPDEFRVALVLREFGDMSYAEIAEHQGVGVQTVKSRLSRGRAQLEERLRLCAN